MSWAAEELCSSRLEDPRLGLRELIMVEGFAEHPEASCPEALGKAGAKAAYRFWNNDRVHADELLAPHAEQTVQRSIQYPVVLIAQDTSEINLTDHPATRGMGYLGSPNCRGLLLHSLLAISPTGVPLGVARQFTWARPLSQLGKRHRRRKTAVKQKESQRWLDGLAATAEQFSKHRHAVLMGDRESDLFDLFATPRPENVDLLVRACREHRRVEHPAKEDALRCVQWYAYRWTIERFHFVLKSGCKIEERQLETVEAMERAIPIFSIVAWRLLWLTLQARETPDTSCTAILEEFEWKALCATVPAAGRRLPATPPTLREAVRMIAHLGGFLGRKCDGEPGPQTLWRGLRRLHDIARGWLAAQKQFQVC